VLFNNGFNTKQNKLEHLKIRFLRKGTDKIVQCSHKFSFLRHDRFQWRLLLDKIYFLMVNLFLYEGLCRLCSCVLYVKENDRILPIFVHEICYYIFAVLILTFFFFFV